MSLSANPHPDLFKGTEAVALALPKSSIYQLLHERGAELFPESLFDDLYESRGRECVPVRVLASVMVLQRFLGRSDREAVEALQFDLRWRHACGLTVDCEGFHPTVLVRFRARLSKSLKPNRIFETVLDLAKSAGQVGRRRVVDSTALYDAVSTMDTVTLVRNGICGVLRALRDCNAATQSRFKGVTRRDDDYASPGKPSCADWDNGQARSALIDALARDGYALTAVGDGETWPAPLCDALVLLGTLLGQDIEDKEGRFVLIQGVSPDRIISTVDPEARHGHKTSSKGFDGYKGHIAIDPDSEIVTATGVTPGNAKDASVVSSLLDDILARPTAAIREAATPLEVLAPAALEAERPEVYGDAGYGDVETLETLAKAGVDSYIHVPAAVGREGCFSKDTFDIDLADGTVTCRAGRTVPIQTRPSGKWADFGTLCRGCSLRDACTKAKSAGRQIKIHAKEATLARGRALHRLPERRAKYNQTRPRVERKNAHLMRHRHGGRRSRMIGIKKTALDFSTLAAAHNIARLAVLFAKDRAAPRAA
jgi:hypothetical protein